MRKSSASNLAQKNHRLQNSSVSELVKWHQELRLSLEHDAEGIQADENRLLLMEVQKALISGNSSKVDSDNQKYKKLIKFIQDQESRE